MTTTSPMTRRLGCRHGGGANLRGKVAQCFRSTRVRNRYLVAELRQPSRKRFTNHAGADDSDVHVIALSPERTLNREREAPE